MDSSYQNDSNMQNVPRVLEITDDGIREFLLNGRQSFGRRVGTQVPEIWTDEPAVTRLHHGEFITDQNGTRYIDNASTNGTYINGLKIPPNYEYSLMTGSTLRVISGDPATHSMVTLVYISSLMPGAVWKKADMRNCGADRIEIGRDAQIILRKNTVSRHHAWLSRSQYGWTITDNNSLHGTYMNGRRISSPQMLRSGDVVNIEGYLFLFSGGILYYQTDAAVIPEPIWPDPEPDPVYSTNSLIVDIMERAVKQKGKKRILLRDVHLEIPSGTYTLLLGGSGAGKTTFVNALTGAEKATGTILYKSEKGIVNIYDNYRAIRDEIGSIPQEELMRMSDDVFHTLMNAAKMRLPRKMPYEEKEQRVIDTLKTFNIYEERDSLVRTLSGGQQKRLNVAIGYITQPSMLFLDEPDSGVDGPNAFELAQSFRRIADTGKIVIMISHTPDRIKDIVDHVIVLAKSSVDNVGRLAYYGPVNEALKFFEVDTMEGIVACVEGKMGNSPDYYIEKYEREVMR